MNITYYYEFFIESLSDFWNTISCREIYLPSWMAEKHMYFNSFYSKVCFSITIDDLLNMLKIPHKFVEDAPPLCSEIIRNFQQNYVDHKIRNPNKSMNIGFQKYSTKFNNMYSPLIGEYREIDGVGYLVSKKDVDKPCIVLFNAYNMDCNIWKPIFNLLKENYQILLLNGNYGDIIKSSDIIYSIMKDEGVKEAVAVTWCSGFRVFANFYKYYPVYIKKVISLTGNYNNIKGKGKLSSFEQSLLSIEKLIDSNHPYQLEKIFSYFLSNQREKIFGIPKDVYSIVAKQFSDNNYLTEYLSITKKLHDFYLDPLLDQFSIPMVNIIASNDSISAFENNELLNGIVDGCHHIMLNFATHWCLWTHATQIAAIINSEMEEHYE